METLTEVRQQDTGYGLIPKAVMRDKTLSLQAKGVYSYLASFAGTTGKAWPSVSLMIAELGINKDTFYKYIRELEDKNFITITQARGGKGRFKHNIYFLQNPSVAPCPKLSDTVTSDTVNSDTIINRSKNNRSKKVIKKIYTTKKEESLAVKDNEKEKVNKGNTVSDNLSTQDKLPKADTSNQQKKVDKVDYQSIVDLYHENCPSLPKVLKINETRKKLIRARLRDYDLDEITTIFINAEASDFLSGRDGAWQSCNFNWLLTDSNALKVLEGTYNPDKSKKTHSNQQKNLNLNFYIPAEEENDHNTEAAAIYAEFRENHC